MPGITGESPAQRSLDPPGDDSHEPAAVAQSAWLSARVAACWDRSWYLVALGCWTLGWFVDLSRRGGMAWHFFTQGSTLLFDGSPSPRALPGGLHMYASYPQLQIGPLAFVLAQGLRHLGPHQGVLATEAVLTAAGLYLVHALMQITLAVRPYHCQPPGALRSAL